MRSFDEGCDDLERKVGHGKLTGKVTVDQVYAAVQHEGYWLTGPLAGHVIINHPQGGEAKYLERPLFLRVGEYMHNLADAVTSGFIVQAMAENMEDLSQQVFEKAPREFEDLRNSGHPTVEDDGHLAYDRAPVRPRLSEAALKEKSKRRALGEGLSSHKDSTLPFRG